MRAFTHWATSADLVDLRLPAHDAGSGLEGEPLGTCAHGGPFVYDVFDAYGEGLITSPNVVVAGSIGAGKSTLVKMVVARALRRGYRALVVDPKGEYDELARLAGSTPIALGRDGWCDPLGGRAGAAALVRALVGAAQGAALSGEQHVALDAAWRAVAAARAARPLAALYRRLGADPDDAVSRSLAVVLYRFVEGDLSGLFDGAGAPLRFDADLVVLDLSAQWDSPSLAVALMSVVAAAQAVVSDGARPGYLVVDEAWALLADPEALSWLRGSWKLARARGLAHVLVLHRFADAAAVGDAGSAARARADGLLRECETAWLFRQPPDEAREIARALGLSSREAALLARVGRGVALVRYGAHRSVVRVEPDVLDRRVIDTDAAMRLRR